MMFMQHHHYHHHHLSPIISSLTTFSSLHFLLSVPAVQSQYQQMSIVSLNKTVDEFNLIILSSLISLVSVVSQPQYYQCQLEELSHEQHKNNVTTVSPVCYQLYSLFVCVTGIYDHHSNLSKITIFCLLKNMLFNLFVVIFIAVEGE